MRLIGIDPGQNTGIAIYEDGALVSLRTITPLQLHMTMLDLTVGITCRVVFEDSRLQSVVFRRGLNAASTLKVARNIGEVDGICRLIVAECERLGVPAHGISPKAKGAKLNAEQFQELTGWDKRSNQHERDAAVVAWLYRNAKA